MENSVSGGFFNITQVGAGYISLNTNGSERMRITSGGNVGIGLTTGTGKLFAKQSTADFYDGINSYASANDSFTGIGHTGSLGVVFSSYNVTAGAYTPLAFFTNDTERMRITSGGLVGIGTSAPLAALDKTLTVFGTGIFQTTTGAGNYNENLRLNRNTGNGYASIALGGAYNSTAGTGVGQWAIAATPVALGYRLDFDYNGATKGYIDPTSGVYVVLSDKDKKKDFEDSNIGLSAILELKPTLYRMKDESNSAKKQLGFIAQEVKDFIPQAYIETIDGFIGLQDRPIIAALVKAIQELNDKIK
jgi:hypothetical protein